MKAHAVVKVYSNGASAIQKIFSSKRKAQDYIYKWAEVDKKDGWDVYNRKDPVYGMVTVKEKGAASNTVREYVVSMDVE